MTFLELLPLLALIFLLGGVAWKPKRSRYETRGYYSFPAKVRHYHYFSGSNFPFSLRYGKKPRAFHTPAPGESSESEAA